MEKDKITLLVISSDNNPVKSFQINKPLIKNYKKYIRYGILFLIFLISLTTAIVFQSIKVSHENNKLNAQINQLNSHIKYYDSLSILKKIMAIDNNLSIINSYLDNRGLMELENSGGELNTDIKNSLIDKIDYFEKKSVIFYSTLRELPLGLPHYGRITSDYGHRRNPFGGYGGEFHAGVDFKGEIGEHVMATGDGIVEKAEWYGGYGNCVIVKHNSGYESLYGHLSKINVFTGKEVKAGDIIGFIGSTGRSTGPHLHYEIRKEGQDINPLPFLKIH